MAGNIDDDNEGYINGIINARDEFMECINNKSSLIICLSKYIRKLNMDLRSLDSKMFKDDVDEFNEKYSNMYDPSDLKHLKSEELNESITNLNELVERILTKYKSIKTGGYRRRKSKTNRKSRKSRKFRKNRKIRKSRKNRKTKK